jgi:membrane fusion protein, multidrug efflux system
LSYTHIVAPATGVVGDKTVQVGQRVQPGEQLLSVVPLNDIWITADFRETQLRKVRRGQPVTVHVDTTGRDYNGYVEGLPGATGELDSLLPPENATGNYVKVVQRLPVRIRLYPGEDLDHRLRPGMSVEPTVWVTGHTRTLW